MGIPPLGTLQPYFRRRFICVSAFDDRIARMDNTEAARVCSVITDISIGDLGEKCSKDEHLFQLGV